MIEEKYFMEIFLICIDIFDKIHHIYICICYCVIYLIYLSQYHECRMFVTIQRELETFIHHSQVCHLQLVLHTRTICYPLNILHDQR